MLVSAFCVIVYVFSIMALCLLSVCLSILSITLLASTFCKSVHLLLFSISLPVLSVFPHY